MVLKKWREESVIEKLRERKLNTGMNRAVMNAKKGFNPFLKTLKKIREVNLEEAKANQIMKDDIQDPDYLRHRAQMELNMNPVNQINLRALQNNPMEAMESFYHLLTRIAGKPEGNNLDLKPFRSKQNKLNLSNYNKKKRIELIK